MDDTLRRLLQNTVVMWWQSVFNSFCANKTLTKLETFEFFGYVVFTNKIILIEYYTVHRQNVSPIVQCIKMHKVFHLVLTCSKALSVLLLYKKTTKYIITTIVLLWTRTYRTCFYFDIKKEHPETLLSFPYYTAIVCRFSHNSSTP